MIINNIPRSLEKNYIMNGISMSFTQYTQATSHSSGHTWMTACISELFRNHS